MVAVIYIFMYIARLISPGVVVVVAGSGKSIQCRLTVGGFI